MLQQKRSSELLEQTPFWEHLSEDERELILARSAVMHYAAGQHIWGGQMDCLGLLLVVEGILRAYLLSPDGKEITLYRTRAGEVCLMAASCVLQAISFETQVEAEVDSEAILIPIDVYATLLRSNVHFECDSYKLTAERFSDVVNGMERLVFLSLEQRIASFLLDEAAESQEDQVRMTHEQIAVHIGSAREVVSRALKGMASRGLVELFRGGVRIRDKTALYQLIA